jgi:AcrR family transcriptional regulator
MTAHRTPETNDAIRRRPYDSPVRRERMGMTRERIVAAGVELVLGFPSWDWTDLTFRAVAERARVGERTVYRHFPSERELHDAIMAGLAERAGVDYDDVTLSNLAEVMARVFRSLGSFSAAPAPTPTDPAFLAADEQRRGALLRAVAAEHPDWSARQHAALAASLDVLWGVGAFEGLVDRWALDPDDAVRVLGWAIHTLVAGAGGDPPPDRGRRRARGA